MAIEDRLEEILDAFAYFGGLAAFGTVIAVIIWFLLIRFYPKDSDNTYDE